MCNEAAVMPCAGISFVIYSVIGFFGAALFGSNTEGNILENDLGGGPGQGVLNMAMSGMEWLCPFTACVTHSPVLPLRYLRLFFCIC